MKNQFATLISTGDDAAPVLRSVKAQGRVEGLVHTMTLSQVVRNETPRNLEVVYTFPLAWGSVLLGMEVTLGGQRKHGVVMAKKEASERYEDAVQSGDAPVMVEKVRGGLYSANIGSLKGGEEMIIEITYAQLLRFEQGRIRLGLPTTVAPRFGDAIHHGSLKPDQAPSNSLMIEIPFTLKLDITGAMAKAKINSPSHPLSQQVTAQGVTVSLERKAWLDRDFVLLLEDLDAHSFAVTGPDTRSGPGHATTLASFCPTLTPVSHTPLNLKVLVDCSGSMEGDSIQEARKALSGLSKLLGSGDSFSYSRFGSSTQRELKPMDASIFNLERLKFELERLEADLGGTELQSALDDTFAIGFPLTESKPQADVLLVTDGAVWNAQALVNRAKASGHRIYALGVGSSPAESLLQELAEASGGACEMVSPHEDMRLAIERLVHRMRNAQKVECSLAVDGKVLWSSPAPSRLVHQETIHLFVRAAHPLSNAPALNINGSLFVAGEIQNTSGDLIARLGVGVDPFSRTVLASS